MKKNRLNWIQVYYIISLKHISPIILRHAIIVAIELPLLLQSQWPMDNKAMLEIKHLLFSTRKGWINYLHDNLYYLIIWLKIAFIVKKQSLFG